MDKTTKIGLLKDEYLLLQKFYEDFDSRVLTIKGWSATVGMVAIGIGFYRKSEFLWLCAAGAALLFWLMEAAWKSFQYAYAPRILRLELSFLNNSFDDIQPLQVYTAWYAAYKLHRFEQAKNFVRWWVYFPHVVTVIAGIGLFALQRFGVFDFFR